MYKKGPENLVFSKAQIQHKWQKTKYLLQSTTSPVLVGLLEQKP